MESTRSPWRVSVESMKQCFMESSWSPLYFGQSLWTPCGVFIDSTWTPHGVHRDYWELVGNAVWTPWKPVGECKVLGKSIGVVM